MEKKITFQQLFYSKIPINKNNREKTLLTLIALLGRDKFIGKGINYNKAKYFYISKRGHIYYGLHKENYHCNRFKEILPCQLGIPEMNSLKEIMGDII